MKKLLLIMTITTSIALTGCLGEVYDAKTADQINAKTSSIEDSKQELLKSDNRLDVANISPVDKLNTDENPAKAKLICTIYHRDLPEIGLPINPFEHFQEQIQIVENQLSIEFSYFTKPGYGNQRAITLITKLYMENELYLTFHNSVKKDMNMSFSDHMTETKIKCEVK